MLEQTTVTKTDEDGDTYEATEWRRECDRCGADVGITDERKHNFIRPKLSDDKLAILWPNPVHRNFDLCDDCAFALIGWIKEPGFKRPVNLNVELVVRHPNGVIRSQSVICDVPTIDDQKLKGLLDDLGSALADSVLDEPKTPVLVDPPAAPEVDYSGATPPDQVGTNG